MYLVDSGYVTFDDKTLRGFIARPSLAKCKVEVGELLFCPTRRILYLGKPTCRKLFVFEQTYKIKVTLNKCYVLRCFYIV